MDNFFLIYTIYILFVLLGFATLVFSLLAFTWGKGQNIFCFWYIMVVYPCSIHNAESKY